MISENGYAYVEVRFAALLLHSALKQPYFVRKHENLIPEESNCPLQELIIKDNKTVLQNLSRKHLNI